MKYTKYKLDSNKFIFLLIILFFIIIFVCYMHETNKYIKNIPEIHHFYNYLSDYTNLSLDKPSGKINSKILILLNNNTISTNPSFHTNQKINNYELSSFINNGKLAIVDIIPFHLPPTKTIDNVLKKVLDECITFTYNIIIPKTNPEYIIGIGYLSQILLNKMNETNYIIVEKTNTENTYKIHNKNTHKSYIFLYTNSEIYEKNINDYIKKILLHSSTNNYVEYTDGYKNVHN